MRSRADLVRNVGGRDRARRLIAGLALVVLAFALDTAIGWRLAAYLVGVVLLATALARYCAVNAALGIDTRKFS